MNDRDVEMLMLENGSNQQPASQFLISRDLDE